MSRLEVFQVGDRVRLTARARKMEHNGCSLWPDRAFGTMRVVEISQTDHWYGKLITCECLDLKSMRMGEVATYSTIVAEQISLEKIPA